MALTAAQKTTLKTSIDASEFAGSPNTNAQNALIAAAYNLAASPGFTAWRTSVSQIEIMANGFDWVRVDNLSVGKARIWEWMFGVTGAINPSKANVRAGIAEAWKGTAQDLAVQAAVLAHCKRLATRMERLFATGTGSVADPGTLTFEGTVAMVDVEEARNS